MSKVYGTGLLYQTKTGNNYFQYKIAYGKFCCIPPKQPLFKPVPFYHQKQVQPKLP